MSTEHLLLASLWQTLQIERWVRASPWPRETPGLLGKWSCAEAVSCPVSDAAEAPSASGLQRHPWRGPNWVCDLREESAFGAQDRNHSSARNDEMLNWGGGNIVFILLLSVLLWISFYFENKWRKTSGANDTTAEIPMHNRQAPWEESATISITKAGTQPPGAVTPTARLPLQGLKSMGPRGK